MRHLQPLGRGVGEARGALCAGVASEALDRLQVDLPHCRLVHLLPASTRARVICRARKGGVCVLVVVVGIGCSVADG